MDVTKILAELRQEREQVQESIVWLERLAAGRRSRPSAWVRGHRRRALPPVASGVRGASAAASPTYLQARLQDRSAHPWTTPENPDLKNRA